MRPRARDLGVRIGDDPTGTYNAITDVPGVWVGHRTLIRDEPTVARTGVTMIVPREGAIWTDWAFAGVHIFNGNGEMTGIPWLTESGMLGSPIGITNTYQVGLVRDALEAEAVRLGVRGAFFLPVVAETYDGWLNDIRSFPLTATDVEAALEAASSGPVAEGNVGGGTGMICHEFKGGIGTASRVVETDGGRFTVGTLVQANYGERHELRVDGVPLGRMIDAEHTPLPWPEEGEDGSIIVVVATDAPLLADQCRRLAQRAVVGLARAGGTGSNGSGDIILAFATGNHLPSDVTGIRDLRMLDHDALDPLFRAVADSVEESILNALCAAEDLTGFEGHTAYALSIEALREVLEKRS
jgi:D-aminopeptidase